MRKHGKKLRFLAAAQRKIFTAILEREKKWITALCPELDVASQGRTYDEAIKNLREAIALYLEEADPSEYKDISAPLITTVVITA